MIFLGMIRKFEIRVADFKEYSANIPLYSADFLDIQRIFQITDCKTGK